MSDGDGIVALTPRPLLRGWSHAVAVPVAMAATAVLAVLSRGDRVRQAGLLVYGIASVLLFTGSAAYHLGGRTRRLRSVLRRLDHANIFVLVAATYTPVSLAVLGGGWRIAILGAVWTLAGVGIATIALPGWEIPRGLRAGAYVGQGLVGIAAAPVIVAAVGWASLGLLLGGGALYILGAAVYSLRRPRLWPRVFGYHEVFHLLVVAANALFYVFMLRRVVPT